MDFVQLVGITQPELDWLAGESPEGSEDRARELARRIAADGNPHLVTDLTRARDYV
ncbi:hypothetical protein [Nocardioides sp.]|uniref:hypothetical protein n=1 Tax=Nocardioides sp. TaxID=35761 RepID=UPI002D7EDC03|nr:hypothetical protein [Nocardioides sp.]